MGVSGQCWWNYLTECVASVGMVCCVLVLCLDA